VIFMTRLAASKKLTNALDLAASKRFRRYKGESEKKVREVDRQKNAVGYLKEAWERCLFDLDESGLDPVDNTEACYKIALLAIKDIEYGACDVEKFSNISICGLEKEENVEMKLGLFLSALINNGKDENYTIPAENKYPHESIHFIGFKNTKNINVNGSVGDFLGDSMIRGSIFVDGDAGNNVGYMMQSGKITVLGDVYADEIKWSTMDLMKTINAAILSTGAGTAEKSDRQASPICFRPTELRTGDHWPGRNGGRFHPDDWWGFG